MVVGSFTAPFISLRPASSLTWLTMCWNCGKCTIHTGFIFLFFYQCRANQATYRKKTLTIIIRVCTGYECQCLVYNRKEPICTFKVKFCNTLSRSFQVYGMGPSEQSIDWADVQCLANCVGCILTRPHYYLEVIFYHSCYVYMWLLVLGAQTQLSLSCRC